MSTSVTRRCTALFVAVTISLLAAFATASQAGAATYYACVKKNGSARIYSKKPKCKRGESKLSWNNVGPAGKNGANGANGLGGANGKEGSSGKEGPPGPFVDTLPNGKSEQGVWSVLENGAKGAVSGAALSFPIPLASAPVAHYIAAGATPPAGCSGSLSEPHAAPGNLCVFEGFPSINLTHLDFYNPETNSETATAAGKMGAIVVFASTAEGTQQATGTFAVTE